jgi:hypothetical protein
MNGFEVGGRPLKIGHVTEKSADAVSNGSLDFEEKGR